MKNTLIYIILAAAFILQSCSDKAPTSNEDIENNDAFYFNSFEADTDTSGWVGLSKEMLVDDPSPAGGKRSLHIGGGCIQPAASIEFFRVMEGNYKISFWAKMGQQNQSAGVVLKISGNTDESKNLIVRIDNTTWKFYQSEGSLYVPANTKMTLEIWVGGFVFADVYLDNLKISHSFSESIYKKIIGMFK